MFDIGWPELFLVAVIVLLVVGPKVLPKVLRNVGKWINKAKSITSEFKDHVDHMVHESELDQIPEKLQDLGDDAVDSVKDQTGDLNNDLNDVFDYDDILSEEEGSKASGEKLEIGDSGDDITSKDPKELDQTKDH